MNRLASRPPPIGLDTATSWVLTRALGPIDAPHEAPGDGANTFALAQRLGLAPRIGGRIVEKSLERELGRAAAEAFRHEHWSTAAREGALEKATNLLARVAEASGTPLILLKHAALRALRIVKPGVRRASDVDVLVPSRLTERFYGALIEAGYRPSGARGHEHQLPPLLDPDDVLVEIHRHIPGVRVDSSGRFATADDLLSSGLVRGAGQKLVPERAVLAAHAVAHGLVQNAGAPRAHSPLRVIADLCDLHRDDPSTLSRARRFTGRELHEDDFAALLTLTELALSGSLSRARGDALALLRHGLASQLDDDYARYLKLRTLTRPLSQHGPWRGALQAVRVAVFPDWAALDSLRDAPAPPHRKALERAARPFVLLVRTLRAARGDFRR